MSMQRNSAIELEKLFNEQGFEEFKWIDPKEIVVSHWVRMKCNFGCEDYGGASCPPNLPSVSESRMFFKEYNDAWIFRFTRESGEPSEEYKSWLEQVKRDLLKLEREVFLEGYVKTFLLTVGNCSLCSECVNNRADCKHKNLARPAPEGMGVDLFSTVSKLGLPIKVLKDRSEIVNRYAILLVQ